MKLDGTHGSPEFEAVTEAYAIAGMPTVIFLDAQGREVPDRVVGAISADEMLEKLDAVETACARPVPVVAAGALACATRW